jgi:hypothetical protein
MLGFLRLWFGLLVRCFRSHRSLLVENVALRQQRIVLKRRHPKPTLEYHDKLFWGFARRFWSAWKRSLIVVTPDTVVRWHRAGFRLYWAWLSRHRPASGRQRISLALRDLIFRMAAENPPWGAPRIHGELRMLGFAISERTVSRWVRRAPRSPEPAKLWLAFLRHHREAIAAMDFFPVPTIRFGILYAFFIIAHDRRRILHFNLTRHPTEAWVVQPLRDPFPYESAQKYLIFDRDTKFGSATITAVQSMGSTPIRTSFRSPWQNGVAERWVGSCRRDLLDHVIVFGDRHWKRLLSEYVRYYHDDRTPLGLAKATPLQRKAAGNHDAKDVLSQPRLGGRHHRYDLAA